ncbi:MAG: hypothetical protein CMF62_00890 [Magnetococcales bacterium]|nr:hypothetical protein [Magnetococcales bacterium]
MLNVIKIISIYNKISMQESIQKGKKKAEKAFYHKLYFENEYKKNIEIEKKINETKNINEKIELSKNHSGLLKTKIYYDENNNFKEFKLIKSFNWLINVALLNPKCYKVKNPTTEYQVNFNNVFDSTLSELQKTIN